MDKDKLEYFRDILNKRLASLMGEAEKAVVGMSSDRGGNMPDPTDRASLETDRNFLLRVKDRERKLINKVKEALERIDDGSYGVCDLCGLDISEKRLDVRPVATYCINCKMEEEASEKKRGA